MDIIAEHYGHSVGNAGGGNSGDGVGSIVGGGDGVAGNFGRQNIARIFYDFHLYCIRNGTYGHHFL